MAETYSYAELDQMWIDAIRGNPPTARQIVDVLEFARDYVHDYTRTEVEYAELQRERETLTSNLETEREKAQCARADLDAAELRIDSLNREVRDLEDERDRMRERWGAAEREKEQLARDLRRAEDDAARARLEAR